MAEPPIQNHTISSKSILYLITSSVSQINITYYKKGSVAKFKNQIQGL